MTYILTHWENGNRHETCTSDYDTMIRFIERCQENDWECRVVEYRH